MKVLTVDSKTDKLSRIAPAVFLLAGLLPEYIAPFMTAIGFALVLKNRIASRSKPRFGDMGKLILIFMSWMIISAFYSSNAISSLASIGVWLLMFLGYYVFTETVDTEEKADSVLFCGGLAAGVAGMIGIGQMFLYHFHSDFFVKLSHTFNPFWHFLDIIIEKLVFILPEFIKINMPSMTFHTFPTRACSTFSNPLFFATFEVALLPLAAYVFLCSKERKRRIIGLFCFLLSIGGVACSYSRGPYLFAVMVFIVLFLHGGKKCLKLVAVGGVSLGALFIFAEGTVKRLFSLLSGNDVSVNTRKLIWDAIFEMIRKKPIFGYGTGFDSVREPLHNVYGIEQPHAHNVLLEIWMENGIIGVALFAAIFVVFLVNIIKLFRKGTQARSFAVTMLASVGGFMLCGMTDCVFYGLKPLQYMMMLLGLSQAIFFIYQSKKE